MMKKTELIRAPSEVMKNLRKKFPGMTNSDRIRVLYNTSLVKSNNLMDIVKMDRGLINVKKKIRKKR